MTKEEGEGEGEGLLRPISRLTDERRGNRRLFPVEGCQEQRKVAQISEKKNKRRPDAAGLGRLLLTVP